MADIDRELTLAIGPDKILPETRIHVSGKSTMSVVPDFWRVDIYNISSSDLAKITAADSISVTGVGGSVLCAGKPVEIMQSWQSSNQITTILIVDGDEFWHSTVSLSVAGGADAEQALRAVLARSTYPVPLAAFPGGVRIRRGQTYYGRTADAVDEICRAVGCRAYYWHGSLYAVAIGAGDVAGEIRDDDILSEPTQHDNVVTLRTDVIGQAIGRRIRLQTETLSGVWRLISQSIDADSLTGAWKSDLMLINEKRLQANGDARWEGIL